MFMCNGSVRQGSMYLFNDTIYNNIRVGRETATREEIEVAARKAQCHNFITAMPDGYETMVGEGGSTLSGGEKQRISIARAILKDAPIVLLDEATASLDPENEVHIQDAINDLVKEKTVVIIAHRLGTVIGANNIVGIDQGRVVHTRIGDICIRNNVWVVADEIHCELVFPGHTYIPFASISQEFLMHSVTCTSPSKAFNLAGLQIANIISADTDIRTKIDKAINVNEVCDVNPFGVEALMAAYNDSKEWLEELKQYLFANYNYLRAYFAEYLPEFPVSMLEGTYLVWVDCSVLNQSSDEIVKTLLEKEKLWVNEGGLYGEAGEGFIRINIACPRQQS